MKKVKSIVLCLLCALLVATSFVGCGNTENVEVDFYKDVQLPHYDYSDGDGSQLNTELFYQNSLEIALGDPAVLYVDGWFYITGTTTNFAFKMWKTQDFTHFINLGYVYQAPENHYGYNSYWAPQLMYDKDADWQYYLGEDAGEGKGLYVLTFSARHKDFEFTKDGCRLSVAFSKNPDGPYVHFEGTNADGKEMTAYDPVFVPEMLKDIDFSEWENAHPGYGPVYKEYRAQIDACPFIDPVTGDKYLYFVRTRNPSGDGCNDIWGVKMKDWVTPIYETTTPLASHGYTTVDRKEKHDFTQVGGRIDEGPFTIYDEVSGKYYLTFSLGGTEDKYYPVVMAVSDSPLGPFYKMMEKDDGLINKIEADWDIHCAGHHCFFTVEDELWIGVHSYEIKGAYGLGSRYFSCEKVQWTENKKGERVMHVNGPTKTIQPLPSDVSGYSNIAESATVTATNASASSPTSRLNDGLRASNEDDCVQDFEVKGSSTTITLTWDDYVTARAIMIYQSYDYFKIFKNIEKIEFYYRELVDGKYYTGKAIIKDLGFNVEANRVPYEYLGLDPEEIIMGNFDEEYNIIRPSTAAVAEFDEIEINKITIMIKKPKGNTGLMISDVVVLGKA